MAIAERTSTILLAILREHIKTAKPVGSEALVEHYELDLSPASVRNAMMDLEEDGYLRQPYTSAGRVPTVKAYRYFLDHMDHHREVPEYARQALLRAAEQTRVAEERLKAVARALAELCSNTVIIGFDRHDIYYTGLSHLFHQPEFAQLQRLLRLSEVVDRFDEVVSSLYDELTDDSRVLLGRENPFGELTGAVMTRYTNEGHRQRTLVGILGPLRMPYDENVALLEYAKTVLP